MIPNDWSDGQLVFMRIGKGLALFSKRDRQENTAHFRRSRSAKSNPMASGSRTHQWDAGSAEIVMQPSNARRRHPDLQGWRLSGSLEPRRQADLHIQGEKKLMEVGFDSEKGPQACSEPVFQTKVMGPAFVLFQFDVSSDSRFIVNSCRSDYSSSLTLLTGWIALLRGH
jgi:hypothetical protein